jgi:hypothetical protein
VSNARWDKAFFVVLLLYLYHRWSAPSQLWPVSLLYNIQTMTNAIVIIDDDPDDIDKLKEAIIGVDKSAICLGTVIQRRN